jgi:hypothetical protein
VQVELASEFGVAPTGSGCGEEVTLDDEHENGGVDKWSAVAQIGKMAVDGWGLVAAIGGEGGGEPNDGR